MPKLRKEVQAVSMDAADRLWIRAMGVGSRLGCHQRADRSFFLFGRQFPVCARCTGVALGQAAAFLTRIRMSPWAGACFLLTMLADHTAQDPGRESTNLRRLVTGFLGGFALGRIYFSAAALLLETVKGLNGHERVKQR